MARRNLRGWMLVRNANSDSLLCNGSTLTKGTASALSVTAIPDRVCDNSGYYGIMKHRNPSKSRKQYFDITTLPSPLLVVLRKLGAKLDHLQILDGLLKNDYDRRATPTNHLSVQRRESKAVHAYVYNRMHTCTTGCIEVRNRHLGAWQQNIPQLIVNNTPIHLEMRLRSDDHY
ncbi:unnamed protein product [Timema podura]|uniref:Uncharacterized protein n=1 Tax=Timema podura TaxID=61482 RepID=A0ABN7NR50_TIMPD|nr:unnamed protein product [Timema podura]